MRAAIVGFGVIGRLHAKVIAKEGELVAVCDISATALAAAPDVPKFTDYTEMLDTVRPDVVHICTPHYLHADMVVAALTRNIHVLCEKPLCIREADIARILAAEAASTALLGVCHQNRYNQTVQYVRRYLADKKILSAVGQVAWHRDAAYYASDAWRGKWETEGGGTLINQALHTADLLLLLCGDPREVTASISTLMLSDAIEVEDTATLHARGGDAPFTLLATTAAGADHPVHLSLCLAGERVELTARYVIVGDTYFSANDERTPLGKSCYGTGHEALIADFYDAAQTGRPFAIDGREAARVVRLILAAYQSHGKPVPFCEA